ncbi:hypothetical protein [Streptomyces capitiformicae]|uniref:Uncharacterized protein n=1 Tax=Streptomyces capitiformicae TaxID=2014920 RepID=A0A918ZWR2_9ACTN|nr:hypothetical protein [Streptomyces capitiformicae]GHE72830.1 hypothetical protein GCM10017771_96640 [Streptomyces capitiformicae]
MTPKKSGTISLDLTVTAYYLDTDTVLFEKSVNGGSVEADTPDADSGPLSWPGKVFGWASTSITIVGALAGSLGAVVALALAVKALRRPGGGPNSGEEGT